MRWVVWMALAAALWGCDPGTEEKVVFVDRSGCLSCHRPLAPDGTAVGIERAHPPVEGRELACEDCHGGDPEARKQSEAHVLPPPGAGTFIRNLSPGELDSVDRDYLRFINPGDLRVAVQSCGSGSSASGGTGCHQDLVETQVTSMMATYGGGFGVPRYRAGLQRRGSGVKAVESVRDTNFRAGEVPGAVPSLEGLEEPRIAADEGEPGPYQDLVLSKACSACHLGSFGENSAPGLFRSSGCTACHMVYANDGLSRTDDPHVDRTAAPHPERHTLTTAIPTGQCVHCHHEGARIGLSYQGVRERGGDEPDDVVTLGEPIFGHGADQYIVDEGGGVLVDETPPDVHFEAGMHCIDCHTSRDVHGTGRIFTHTANAVEVSCQDCHGTGDEEAQLVTRHGTALDHMFRDEAGDVWLRGKVTGALHPVTQIARSVEGAGQGSALHRAMGRGEDGFSHLDRVACASCHSGWVPTCYGCHITIDMQTPQRSQLTGLSSPGALTEVAGPARHDRLILMLDTQGLVAPSTPAERLFVSVIDGSGATIIDAAARTGPDGSPGMGHRAFSPHTVRRTTPFQACATCHPTQDGVAGDGLRAVMGFGSEDFVFEDGEGRRWLLDQLLDDGLDPQVLIGHDAPFESRPLTREIIDRMLSVTVDP